MHVLILGSDTPLGHSLQEFLLDTGRHEVVALTRSACRWRSERQAKKIVQRSGCQTLVDLRINTALDGDEEPTEQDVDRCHWLAKACQRNAISYLYLSSYRLFTGNIGRPYSEEDYPDNEGPIGQLLLSAEGAVRDRCERHLILRLGPVFSHRGGNWLPRFMEELQRDSNLVLDSHLRASPVSACDAARVISALLDQLSADAEPWGIYHYCSSDSANSTELVEALLAAASQFTEFEGQTLDIEATSEQNPRANRALDCRKIRDTFAVKQGPWREYVAGTVQRYFQQAG